MRSDETIYRGWRPPEPGTGRQDSTTAVTVTVRDPIEGGSRSRELTPARSQKVRNHSPDGFNWGYGGSGPAQLALALMLDFCQNDELAQFRYQDFKDAHVSRWQLDHFEIRGREIREFLERLNATHPYVEVGTADVHDGDA